MWYNVVFVVLCYNISKKGGLQTMFLKAITKNNVTRLYFYESYYQDGKVRQRSIESLGRLDDLQKKYPDPIAHFSAIAKERTEESKQQKHKTVSIDLSTTMDTDERNLKNVGYCIIKNLYKELELDRFWKQKQRNHAIKYDPELIFRLLVISRMLYPDSKKATYENRNIFFENMDGFSLDDVYNCLDLIDTYNEEMQKWIFNKSQKLCERNLSTVYFDCTNYYFDIGCSDLDTLNDDGLPVDKNGNVTKAKYRKRGPEKNHRPDPIVGMGLLMDKNGIPIAYDLFPGNESEKVHMRPIINRVKTQYTDSRIIIVADRGLNTSDNIYFINGNNKKENNKRDGYVYGQSIRGADAEFKEWVLSGDYIVDKLKNDDEVNTSDDLTEDKKNIIFKHKSRIYPKTIQVNVTSDDGKTKKKKKVVIDQKQMVYYSERYAKKQKHDRYIMVERAKDLIKNPKKYDRVSSAGSAAYVRNISFDKKTGLVVNSKSLSLNEEKIAEEEKYDGYYSIVTSELEMSDIEMRNVYRGLALIEETFKVTKSDFQARPVHVWTNPHINAHFATCFTALVLMRLLQTKLNNKYPVGKILNSLRNYSCTKIDVNTYQFVYFDEILKMYEDVLGITLNHKYRSQIQIRRMLKY